MNPDENLQAYEFLGQFYRKLVEPREHVPKQTKLVQKIVAMEGLSSKGRILDAACGTGDVIDALYVAGFSDIAGLDGSPTMMSQFNGASGLSITCVRWAQLDDYFATNGTYEMIFLLGNSLAHHPVSLIPKLLRALYEGLNQGGVLLLDLRSWEHDAGGRLYETDRPISVYRYLGEMEILGNNYWVEDMASYDEQKQTIKYRLRQVGASGSESRPQTLSVSYSLFDHRRLEDMLRGAGFQDGAVETRSFPEGWSYLVVVARK